MKLIPKWFNDWLVAVSILLLPFLGVLWILSYQRYDCFQIFPPADIHDAYVVLLEANGQILLGRSYNSMAQFRGPRFLSHLVVSHVAYPPDPRGIEELVSFFVLGFSEPSGFSLLGIRFVYPSGYPAGGAILMPHWILVTASAIAPSLWLVGRRKGVITGFRGHDTANRLD
jgi:hypothetical protein